MDIPQPLLLTAVAALAGAVAYMYREQRRDVRELRRINRELRDEIDRLYAWILRAAPTVCARLGCPRRMFGDGVTRREDDPQN